MAQTIIIKKGDEMSQDVALIKPDTKVNHRSTVKYPTADCSKIGGPILETYEDADGATFTNPTSPRSPILQPEEDESSGSSEESG